MLKWTPIASPRVQTTLTHQDLPLLVKRSSNVFGMVTGNNHDSRDELANFPELRTLIEVRYDLGQTIEDFEIYLRRSSPPPVAQ